MSPQARTSAQLCARLSQKAPRPQPCMHELRCGHKNRKYNDGGHHHEDGEQDGQGPPTTWRYQGSEAPETLAVPPAMPQTKCESFASLTNLLRPRRAGAVRQSASRYMHQSNACSISTRCRVVHTKPTMVTDDEPQRHCPRQHNAAPSDKCACNAWGRHRPWDGDIP